MKRRRIVFVIGMHRSGTSALARAFSLRGAALPLRLMPRNFGNPTGYWEPHDAVELNEHFLRSHGSSWDDPSFALQLNPIGAEDRRAFVVQLAEFLETGFHPGGTIVVKDPRITILLPYWLEAAHALGWHCTIVHAFRHPSSVAASLRARDGMDSGLSLALWVRYNLLGERDARGIARVFQSYEELICDWEPALERCERTLRLDLRGRDGARAEIAEFLAPRLDHFDATARSIVPVEGALREVAARMHEILERGARGVVRSAALDAIYRDYAQAGLLVGAVSPWRGVLSPVAEGPQQLA